ncbi:rho guanine nucleotide exchange factor 11-like isoform X2 [Tachypleus tridentatus]|uniref:rho guanine nucleotide exchange factor 11-like isoform X2 n=1 Tax=Tachypleus tridentatus TaxID=6853 RepID=UPI003FD68F72
MASSNDRIGIHRVTSHADQFISRTVIVQKDENGYGFTVTGHNPVYVQSVKADGAASRAGVQVMDQVIKVNGTLVTHMDHKAVVELIKSGSYVALTLSNRVSRVRSPLGDCQHQSPECQSRHSPSRLLSGNSLSPLSPTRSSIQTERITRPQPVDPEKQNQLNKDRLDTMRKMLNNEQRFLEEKRKEHAKNPCEKFWQEIVGAMKRVKAIEDQLINIYPDKGTVELSPANPLLEVENTVQSTTPASLTVPIFSSQHTGSLSPNLRRLIKSSSPKTKHPHSSLDGQNDFDTQQTRKSSASEGFAEPPSNKRLQISMKGLSFGQYEGKIGSPGISPPATPVLTTEVALGERIKEVLNGEDSTSQEEVYGTPPESFCSSNVIGEVGTVSPIMSMEDDDDWPPDSQPGQQNKHGPFETAWKLLMHPAHLAVFLSYLISNSDPSSLFFYLIAQIYEEGNGKEMKKWAYEIYSTFLVPKAPMKVKNVDESILHDIDDVLLNHIEKEDLLKSLFQKARKKAVKDINEHLEEFNCKRTIGLGTFFGPPDSELNEALNDRSKEMKIMEDVLVPILDKIPFKEDPENINDRNTAVAAALATVLKHFGVKSQYALNLLERYPIFVAKERTRLRFLQRNKKPVLVKGHTFQLEHWHSVIYCNHCQHIIWGIGYQGYQCQNCDMNVHKSCLKVVDEWCIGVSRIKKDKKKEKRSGLMENIMGKGRKPSQSLQGSVERAKRLNEDWSVDSGISSFSSSTGENHLDGGSLPGDRNSGSFRFEKRTDGLPSDPNFALHHTGSHDTFDTLGKKGTAIGRSESFRQRRENRHSFRKRSDPNIPRSKSDVDVDDKPVSNLNHSGSSSNSSLSARSLESPCTSVDMVHRTPSGTPADPITGPSPLPGILPSSGLSSTFHHYNDSDLEAEADQPNWQDNVNVEELRLMKPKEKKRQDVINELFHTERTHVRNLKVLDGLFFRPLQQEQLLPSDLLQLLFPNLDEMLEIHGGFNKMMKIRRHEEPIIGDIGEMMLQMFNGCSGERLKKAASTFCRNQSVALEQLKNKQRKEQKLAQFLADAEMQPLCRRLQLKDIIVAGFQRLTKYPLLLENIAKYSAPNTEEYANLLQAVDCSKQILAYVNQAVKESENYHRLCELQKRMDRSAFEKVDSVVTQNYKHLDLTKHNLIYEGLLTWRLPKKTLDIHVVLFEDILVLLQKQDDKLLLKYHNSNLMSGREDTKVTHSPILRVQNIFTRNVATDERGFFLVSTSEQHAIYEFLAASPSERKIWLQHITAAAEAYKPRGGQTPKRQEPSLLISGDTEEIEQGQKENSPSKELLGEVSKETESSGNTENMDTPVNPQADSSMKNNNDASPAIISTEASQSDESSSESSQKEEPTTPTAEEDNKKSRRSFQKVEILQIADGPQLIEPSEVKIIEGAVLQTAEPVLTPLEKLRRKDQKIAESLAEKQEIIAEYLRIPPGSFAHFGEIASDLEGPKEIKELVLACMYHANQLTLLLNESLRVREEDRVTASSIEVICEGSSEAHSTTPSPSRKFIRFPGVPPEKLRTISYTLNRHLTHLMSLVTEREEERNQLRQELHTSREQIHMLHEAHRHCGSLHLPSPNTTESRPNSFISVTSSFSEGVYDQESETIAREKIENILPDNECCAEDDENQSTTCEELIPEMYLDALSDEGVLETICNQEMADCSQEGSGDAVTCSTSKV